MIKNCSVFLLFMLVLAQTACTQTPTRQQLEGTLLHKPWTKSSQSYCAQGSDYFVVKTKSQKEVVLENNTKTNLNDYENQAVKLSGYFREKEIAPKNDYEQHPVEQMPIEQAPSNSDKSIKVQPFRCKVFVIEQILNP